MKSVPLDDIKAAWEGTSKKIDNCRRGRGFGTRDERLGGSSGKAPDVEPPVCPHCKSTGVYRPGRDGRGGFYGCPKYQSHAAKKWTVDAVKWVAEQQAKQPTPAAEQHQKVEPLKDTDIFGGREPGMEG